MAAFGCILTGFNQINKFCAKLLHKISFIILAKKIFGVRCSLKWNILHNKGKQATKNPKNKYHGLCSVNTAGERKGKAHVFSQHSHPQRPRSFWSAPRIATSGQVQRHSGLEWLCKHNRLRPEPIRLANLASENAQSDGKSVKRILPVLAWPEAHNSQISGHA